MARFDGRRRTRTDNPDNSYVIPDGIAGYNVPLDDAGILPRKLKTLIIDTALREELGDGARRWVIQEISPEKLAMKTAS